MIAQKVAIVTGGARGIGAATSKIFSQNGYFTAIVDLLDVEGASLAQELIANGGQAVSYRCDVSSESDVAGVVQAVVKERGRIDLLVNNAGRVLVKPLDEVTWEEYQRVVNTNLGGAFLFCKHVLPIMKQQKFGAIVNMASVSGHVGQIDHAMYGATKGAIIALTRALAWEVASYNIRVNSLSPGSVDTPMLWGDIEIESKRTGRSFEEVKREREAEQAFRRWADPGEIASAVYFLASGSASFVTGADLLVDCGWVAK
jgi:NAD(P)-dependent dehydrogenase (short-subunit alcohol dehydrogenase family)